MDVIAAPADSAPEQFDGAGAEHLGVLPDRGQTGAGPTRQRRIVVADDADRLGHLMPQIGSGGHDVESLDVIAGEERIEAIGQGL